MAKNESLNNSVRGDVAKSVIEMKSGESVSVHGGNEGETNLRMKDHELCSTNGLVNGNGQGTIVDGPVIESAIVIDSGGTASISEENEEEDRALREKNDELLSDGVLNEETLDGQETMSRAEQGTDANSSNLVDSVMPETLMLLNSKNAFGSTQDSGLEVKRSDLRLGKMLENPKGKMARGEEQSCVIDVKHGGGGGFRENLNGESVCRICHLSNEGSVESRLSSNGSLEITVTTMTAYAHTTAASMDLIQLGCACKDELGIAHVRCAEAWFKLKGDRLCEICGQTAKNITGMGDNRFMEEWNERRYARDYNSSSDRDEGCWRGPPFCNFLMACLVIAFVVPWFFRVDMF